MKSAFIVFRRTSPMVLSSDGCLYFSRLHPRSQNGPTIFADRESAHAAIKATNAEDRKDKLGWTESFGKLWIMRCKVEGGPA